MPTIMSHAVAAAALAAALPKPAFHSRFAVLGAACAMAPDIDVIGFALGIQYGDLFGHRGFTHSLLFAATLSAVALAAACRPAGRLADQAILWLYFFCATASHGVLDALTNGGLGVAFFAPFDVTRYFFPLRPIAVSPIGVAFFSAQGMSVLASEVKWVWLPCAAFAVIAVAVRRVAHSHLASRH